MAEGRDRRSRRRPRVVVVVALVLLVAAAWAGSDALSTTLFSGDGAWREVERRDLVLGVPLEGELRAVRSAVLVPPQIPNLWQVKVASLVTEGTEVEEGDPVITFDATELRQRLRQTVAERDSAQKELEKRITDLALRRRDLELRLAEAKARLRKAEFLLDVPADVVARNELESSRIDRRLAGLEIDYLERNLEHMDVREKLEVGTLRSRRDVAASKVEQMQRDVEALTLRAPRAGTVIYQANWQGEKLKVGETVWRGRNLGEIPDLSEMEAEAEVAEGDAGRLEVGQPVSFRLDAYPDREYRGRIRSIRRTVQRKSNANPTKVVKVVLSIDESDPVRMRPGMRLRGRVETERHEDVLAVPEDAVFTGPDGAWVTRRGLLGEERVYPRLGERDDRYFRVVDGLEPGDRVRVDGEDGK